MWSDKIFKGLKKIVADVQAVGSDCSLLDTDVSGNETVCAAVFELSTLSRTITRTISSRLQDCEIAMTQDYFASLMLKGINLQQITASTLPGAIVPTASPDIFNQNTPSPPLSPCDGVANDEFAFRMPVQVLGYFSGQILFSFGIWCSSRSIQAEVSRLASLRLSPPAQGALVEQFQDSLNSGLSAQLASAGSFPLTRTSIDRFQLEPLGCVSGAHVSILGRMDNTLPGPQGIPILIPTIPNPKAADIGTIPGPPWPGNSNLAFRMKTAAAMPILREKLFTVAQSQMPDIPDLTLKSVDVQVGPVKNSLAFTIVVTYTIHVPHRKYIFFGPTETDDYPVDISLHFFGFPWVAQEGDQMGLSIKATLNPDPTAKALFLVPLFQGAFDNIQPSIDTDYLIAYLEARS